MQIHQLQPKHSRKTAKRVGRGGKRGTTSGKGTKGQRAHGSTAPRPAIRDLIQRLPKLRGYRNKPKSSMAAPVNLSALNRLTATEVTLETLRESGIIRKTDSKVKILGDGEITKALTITGVAVSETAKKKIEAAGGKVV